MIGADQHTKTALIALMPNRREVTLHHLVTAHRLQFFIVAKLVNQIIEDDEAVPFCLWSLHIAILHILPFLKRLSCYFPLRSEPFAALFSGAPVWRMSRLAELPLAV